MTNRGGRAHLRGLFFLCLGLAVWQLGSGAWIHAKAALAQVLIARAWSAPEPAKPWPWADTWPVARLQVPALAVDLYVLAGEQGNALAFGPGHVRQSAVPGTPGLSVIGGHRDTHFAFLADLAPGQLLWLTPRHGAPRRYRISSAHVADIRSGPLSAGGDAVLLVTCYPFDAVRPGGPLRYVVLAEPVAKVL